MNENIYQEKNYTDIPNITNLIRDTQIVYSWKAPIRAYKVRSKFVLKFFIAVSILLSLIVYFFSDIMLIVPIWSVLFLFYVFTITPPPIIENRITHFGIETQKLKLPWEVISSFYFTKRFNFIILTITTKNPYRYHFYMIIPDEKIHFEVSELLAQHVSFDQHPNLTFTEKLIDWISCLIPDDEDDIKKTS